jgi:hypothetical protein
MMHLQKTKLQGRLHGRDGLKIKTAAKKPALQERTDWLLIKV